MKIQLPIKNFDKQQEPFDSPATFVIVPKGRRFGLTKGAANNYIKIALKGKFKKGLWVDTINSNIERYVERYFIPALSKLPQETWKWRKQQKILQIGGSYIDFRSVDNPESIEGFGYDYAFLNEAGIILKNQYLWNNAIRPMLWDYKCKTIIGGTPKGRGVFYDLYQRALDQTQPEFAGFKYSSFDNPYIQHQQIMEDIKSMPERVVRQEIYAEFLEDNGVVFRGISEVAVLNFQEPIPNHLYVIGCDLAKTQDFTVLTVYDRTNNHQVYQMRFNQLEWPFQRKKIKDLSDKYNHALVILDSTGVGEPTFDDLSREGVPCEPYKFNNTSKKELIEKLSNWIELKNIQMLKLDETINEFNAFTYDYSEKTGRVLYNAPVGFHDDIVISHGLAIWGLQPIPVRKMVEKMTIIQKDLYEKKKDLESNQDGKWDVFDYEEI